MTSCKGPTVLAHVTNIVSPIQLNTKAGPLRQRYGAICLENELVVDLGTPTRLRDVHLAGLYHAQSQLIRVRGKYGFVEIWKLDAWEMFLCIL